MIPLRARRSRLYWLSTCTSVGITFAVSAYAEARQPQPAQAQQQSTKYAADYLQTQEMMAGNSSRMIWFVIFDLGLTVVGLFLIGATVYFTRKAANAATNTLRVITENGQRELRAYLSVEPMGLTPPPGKGDEGHGLVRIHNVGKTPANRVSILVHTIIAKERETTEFPITADNECVSRSINPGADMIQGSENHFHLNNLGTRGLYIFVYGVAYYDDGFRGNSGQPNRRRTYFCHRYQTESANSPGSAEWNSGLLISPRTARYHLTNNEAD